MALMGRHADGVNHTLYQTSRWFQNGSDQTSTRIPSNLSPFQTDRVRAPSGQWFLFSRTATQGPEYWHRELQPSRTGQSMPIEAPRVKPWLELRQDCSHNIAKADQK